MSLRSSGESAWNAGRKTLEGGAITTLPELADGKALSADNYLKFINPILKWDESDPDNQTSWETQQWRMADLGP